LNFIHIGLGKTATTTLQRHVFPELSLIRNDVVFNHPTLMRLIKRHTLAFLDENELETVRDILSNKNNFISYESLVDWNPRNWESAANSNLELFGKNSHILITVRDMRSYLKSAYQQMVHQGNVKKPEDFFISGFEYDSVSDFFPKKGLHYFDVDSFDLERLYLIYKKRFDKVTIVPIEMIKDFRFLKDHYSLSNEEIKKLSHLFENAPKSNVAYSNFAMNLTFIRERLLLNLGLRTLGSEGMRELIARNKIIERDREKKIWFMIAYRDIHIINKILLLPFSIIIGLIRPFWSWRGFMQNFIDKIFLYKKYQLPKKCYFNDSLYKKNNEFIESLKGVKNSAELENE